MQDSGEFNQLALISCLTIDCKAVNLSSFYLSESCSVTRLPIISSTMKICRNNIKIQSKFSQRSCRHSEMPLYFLNQSEQHQFMLAGLNPCEVRSHCWQVGRSIFSFMFMLFSFFTQSRSLCIGILPEKDHFTTYLTICFVVQGLEGEENTWLLFKERYY